MKVIPGNAQAVGERHEQQDAFGFIDKDDTAFVAHGGVLAVVADGMGGMALGRQASQRAVDTLLKAYVEKRLDETIPEALTRALHAANADVVKLADEADLEGNVGTTVVAAVIHQGQLHWVSVGDSHLYLSRQGTLKQLTTDHVYAAELDQAVREGNLSQEEAERHPERRSLTSYVGLPGLTAIDTGTGAVEVGDRVLLCSDGLYGSLSEAEMAAALTGDPQRAAEALIGQGLAKRYAHQDNLTAVVMAWETEERLAQQQQQESLQATDVPKVHRFSRMGIGIAIFLAWLLGFATGRYWETAKSLLTHTGQTGEGAQTLSAQEREKLSPATQEQHPAKEGANNE